MPRPKKKGFVLYADLYNKIEKWHDDRAGVLFKAILAYANGITPSIEDEVVDCAFDFIKEQIDRDTEHYNEVCAKRKEASEKANAVRWSKASQMGTNGSNSSQMGTNGSNSSQMFQDTDKDTDTDKEKDIDTDNNNPKGYEKFDFSFLKEEYKEAFFMWLNYKRERGESYKDINSLIAAYEKLCDLCNGSGHDAIAVVKNSMACNYAGLVALYKQKSGNAHTAHATDKISEEYPKWKR